MKVLLIIAAVIFLIGCIPVGVLFRYHQQIELKLTVLFLKIGILPKKPLSRKKREKAAAKKAAKAAKKAEAKEKKKRKQQAQSLIAKPKAPESEKPPAPKKPLTDQISELIPWARLAARFVGEFFHRKLLVRRLYIRAALAGGDPAKTAKSVGAAWETIGIAVPILDQAFRVRQRKIAVYPDFTASKTELEAELHIRLRVGGVVLLALKYAGKALALYIRQKRAAKQEKKDRAEAEVEIKTA